MTALRQRLEAAGYSAAWKLTGLAPEALALRVFEGVGGFAARRGGRGVQRLRENLARVVPEAGPEELDRLTDEAMRSYLRYWAEAFRLPYWPIDDLVARIDPVNESVMRDPLAEGRGVLIALPHVANWDWAGAWACGTGAPLMTVAERLRPESLYDRFVAYRESLGMTILPATGGDPPIPQLEAHLREGGLVCLVADRDLSSTGLVVDLCGHPASLPAGPAVIAQRTGADLVAATLRYVGSRLEIHLHGPLDTGEGATGVKAATQAMADVFSEGLRKSPTDWHMLQRVFLDEPPEESR